MLYLALIAGAVYEFAHDVPLVATLLLFAFVALIIMRIRYYNATHFVSFGVGWLY